MVVYDQGALHLLEFHYPVGHQDRASPPDAIRYNGGEDDFASIAILEEAVNRTSLDVCDICSAYRHKKEGREEIRHESISRETGRKCQRQDGNKSAT
jgi:hypothetical protein